MYINKPKNIVSKTKAMMHTILSSLLLSFIVLSLLQSPTFAIEKVGEIFISFNMPIQILGLSLNLYNFFLILLFLLLLLLQSYIVYLGGHTHGLNPTMADLDYVTNSHYELLASSVGRYKLKNIL